MSTEYPEVRRLVDSLARLMKPLLDQHIPQTLAPAFSGKSCHPTSSPYLSCFLLHHLILILLLTCHSNSLPLPFVTLFLLLPLSPSLPSSHLPLLFACFLPLFLLLSFFLSLPLLLTYLFFFLSLYPL